MGMITQLTFVFLGFKFLSKLAPSAISQFARHADRAANGASGLLQAQAQLKGQQHRLRLPLSRVPTAIRPLHLQVLPCRSPTSLEDYIMATSNTN